MQLNLIEQAVLNNMRELPLAEQQSLLDFSLYLKHKVQSEENSQKTDSKKTQESVDNFYKAEYQNLSKQIESLWNKLTNLFNPLPKTNIEKNKQPLNKPHQVEHQHIYNQIVNMFWDKVVDLFNFLLMTIAVVTVIIMLLIIMWAIIHTPSLKTPISDFVSSLQRPQQEVQVAEAIDLLVGLKVPSEEWFGSWGKWPTNIETLGVRTKGKYTSHISIEGMGYKAILKDPNISGEIKLTYDPAQKIWNCTGTVPQHYLPTACRR